MAKPLISPDYNRCQATISNRVSFVIGGSRESVRCPNKPTTLARDAKGKIGSMSVCDSCLKAMKVQVGDAAIYTPIVIQKKDASAKGYQFVCQKCKKSLASTRPREIYTKAYRGPCSDSFCYAICDSEGCRPIRVTVCDACEKLLAWSK